MKAYLRNPLFWALAVLVVCLPVSHLGLFLWSGCDPDLYGKAISFQPEVFLWMPLCSPFIVLLAGPVFFNVWDDLRAKPAHRTGFIVINTTALLLLLGLDLSSPNVMLWEIKKERLGKQLAHFRCFEFDPQKAQQEGAPTTPTPEGGGESTRDSTIEFGKAMADFRLRFSAWSLFRPVYYCVLLIGWTLMFLQISTSIYVSYRCNMAPEGAFQAGLQRQAVQLLGATIPVLPFILLRRINHLHKTQLYGIDEMDYFDWLLFVLVIVCIVLLLLSAYKLAQRIQSALSVMSAIASSVFFIAPKWTAEMLFDGTLYNLVGVILSLPVMLALILWPWLIPPSPERRDEGRSP